MVVRSPERKPQRNPWWHKTGLTERQEHAFRLFTIALVCVMSTGWAYAIYVSVTTPLATFAGEKFDARGKVVEVISAAQPNAAPVASEVSAALLEERKSTAYLSDAALGFLTPLRGHSGKLNVAMRTPGEEVIDPADPHMQARYEGGGGSVVSRDFTAPSEPGLYRMAVELNQASRQLDDLKLITLVPFSQKRSGRIGPYFLGSWPFETGGRPKSPKYANPDGFIEVTVQNRDTNVSEHFKLRDFLTKDQGNVWPKYLLLQPELVDKLELVITEMQRAGVNVRHVQVMSGFRTPRYNVGGGNTAGRASLSRHMYGDAADIFLDNNRDGSTDDVNGDGRVNVKDAEFIAALAERVERKYPSLVGGIGVYTACCGHGPFTHIDVRGYRARWRGSGNG